MLWLLNKWQDLERGRYAEDMSEFWSMLDRNRDRDLLLCKMAEGLQNETGYFHSHGEPGSGKSTVMWLIRKHPWTRDWLRKWAGEDKQLVLVRSDFVKLAGGRANDLQDTLEGFRRSVLYGVAKQCPSLIPGMFPKDLALDTSTDGFRVLETAMNNRMRELDSLSVH